MKIIKSGKPRSLAGGEALEQDVKKIITDVRAGGDRALDVAMGTYTSRT